MRAVVVTGTGGAFCAGGDVKGMSERNQGKGDGGGGGRGPTLDEAIAAQRLSQRETAGKLYGMPKPTIASLPGAAAGAAASAVDILRPGNVCTGCTGDVLDFLPQTWDTIVY